MVGPRDRHRLTGRDEWTHAVSMGQVEPRDLPDVLAIAFTAACLDAIGQPEILALEVGEDIGGHTRAAYVLLARSLGMGRERFRLTMQGGRWVTLPEISAALLDPLVGEHLIRNLDRLGRAPRVLEKDRDSGGTSPHTKGGKRVGSSPGRRGEDRTVSDSVETRAARVRADVVALDREQQRGALRGEAVPGTDWSAVRRLLGVARPTASAPVPSTASRVRAAGVESLAEVLRAILREVEGPLLSYRIKQAVRAQAAAITDAQVDTALARLAKRGEARRVSHGVYEATDQMRGVPEKR